MRTWRHSRRAFTLVEVLVVVTIVGIAGAIVIPIMLKDGSLHLQAASRMVIADIIYAQNEAITQGATRKVIFDAVAGTYSVTDTSNTPIAASWKAGGVGAANYVVVLANDARFQGVSIENVDFGGGATIEFDELGAPVNGGQLELVAGDFRYRVSVAPFTGRVTVAQVTSGG